MSALLAEGLIVLAGIFGWRAIRHLARALHQPERSDSGIRLIRGIRALILAVSAVALAIGIVVNSRAMVIIAAVFLAEELYETGVVLLALRHQRMAEHRDGRPG